MSALEFGHVVRGAISVTGESGSADPMHPDLITTQNPERERCVET
jgi:hypothetical protein